ncbi:MAG: hypothetical protein ACXAEU_23800 [Candidatus Hodarchaeales archaeon]|jgi:hypothetical protein
MRLTGFFCSNCSLYLQFKFSDKWAQTSFTKDQTKKLNILINNGFIKKELPPVCPGCDAEALLPVFNNLVDCVGRFEEIYLTFDEMWGALNGMGFPEEQVTLNKINRLMTRNIIAKLDICEGPNKDRVIIKTITFDNGETAHFTISSGLACIYKITKEEKKEKKEDGRNSY